MSQSDVLGQNIVYVVAVLSCVHLSNLMWTYITEKKGKRKRKRSGISSYTCDDTAGQVVPILTSVPGNVDRYRRLIVFGGDPYQAWSQCGYQEGQRWPGALHTSPLETQSRRSVSLRGGWTLETQVIGPWVSLVLGFCGLWPAAWRPRRAWLF